MTCSRGFVVGVVRLEMIGSSCSSDDGKGYITGIEAGNLEGIEEVTTVQAAVGDWIIVRSRHVDGAERRGEIVGVRGDGGAPPWDVRWTGEEHEALFFPGTDASIEPRPTHPA